MGFLQRHKGCLAVARKNKVARCFCQIKPRKPLKLHLIGIAMTTVDIDVVHAIGAGHKKILIWRKTQVIWIVDALDRKLKIAADRIQKSQRIRNSVANHHMTVIRGGIQVMRLLASGHLSDHGIGLGMNQRDIGVARVQHDDWVLDG